MEYYRSKSPNEYGKVEVVVYKFVVSEKMESENTSFEYEVFIRDLLWKL